jgi:hypothetical protein
MRTGRLSISRGHQIEASPELAAPRLKLVQKPAKGTRAIAEPPPAPANEEAAPVASDYHAVHDRLGALERLARLLEAGALSAEEFAAEKALILALPADEILLCNPAPVHFVPAAPRARPQGGPSLIGRMLNWKFLIFSLAAGLSFSYAAQPQATARFLDQSLRTIGI